MWYHCALTCYVTWITSTVINGFPWHFVSISWQYRSQHFCNFTRKLPTVVDLETPRSRRAPVILYFTGCRPKGRHNSYRTPNAPYSRRVLSASAGRSRSLRTFSANQVSIVVTRDWVALPDCHCDPQQPTFQIWRRVKLWRGQISCLLSDDVLMW